MSPQQPSPSPIARALLIGSPLSPLIGPANDLLAMEAVLSRYGFTAIKCFLPGTNMYSATRAGITSAWRELIRQTGPSDAVVIYYSGHGGLTLAEDWGDDHGGRGLQYIVPLDFGETKEGDWRGISDVEIAELLHQTTQRTKNVTIILDCCHSARMARGPTSVKRIDPTDYGQVISHIKKMSHRISSERTFHHERNPDVVSIVAAATTEPAFEKRFPTGARMGVLTEALTEALSSAPHSGVSWRGIMRRARDRMSRTCPEQYAQIEGPHDRLPFREEVAELDLALSVVETAAGVVLKGGSLHGVAHGDIYECLVKEKVVAEAEVTRVGPAESELRLKWKPAHSALPHGAKGFLLKKALDQFPIEFSGSKYVMEKLTESLRKSRFLRPADMGEGSESLAKVEQTDSRLKIWDYRHYLLRDWEMELGENVNRLVAKSVVVIESLARAQHMLSLHDDPHPEPLGGALRQEIGIVESGIRKPYPTSNVTLVEGSRMYISVTNIGSQTLYVSIFDICADSAVLLSNGSPSGIELPKGASHCFGEVDFSNELRGSLIGWPPEVPKVGPVSETLVLVVTDGRIDLRDLETGSGYTGRGEKTTGLGSGTELADLVDSIAFGELRFVAREKKTYKHLRYGVVKLPCQLEPSHSQS